MADFMNDHGAAIEAAKHDPENDAQNPNYLHP